MLLSDLFCVAGCRVGTETVTSTRTRLKTILSECADSVREIATKEITESYHANLSIAGELMV